MFCWMVSSYWFYSQAGRLEISTRQYFYPPLPASSVFLNSAHNPNCSTKIHSDQIVLKQLRVNSGDVQTAVSLAVFQISPKRSPYYIV